MHGFYLDVSRAVNNFDYSVIECLKNCFMISGKFNGYVKRFKKVPVIVFTNEYPNRAKLSDDRWHIITLGSEGLHLDGNFNYSAEVSILLKVPPKKMSDLSETFDLRALLLEAN